MLVWQRDFSADSLRRSLLPRGRSLDRVELAGPLARWPNAQMLVKTNESSRLEGQGKTYIELAEDIVVCLRGVGVPAHRTFDDGQAKTPDVGLNAVRASTGATGMPTTCNTLGGHVTLTANVCLRNASNKVTAHSEIADLDLSTRVDKDVRRFHVSMDDVMFVLETLEAHDSRESDFAQDVFRYTPCVDFFHRSTIHELNTDVDSSLLKESAVEIDDEG